MTQCHQCGDDDSTDSGGQITGPGVAGCGSQSLHSTPPGSSLALSVLSLESQSLKIYCTTKEVFGLDESLVFCLLK